MASSPLCVLAALLLVFGVGCADGAKREESPPSGKLGLFATLPIYWSEGGDISAILDSDNKSGWVRQAIEERYAIVPLDALEAKNLAGLDQLMLAQPRPLAPSENVALDNWVRAGGELLVFADPRLTRHSELPLGDPRRPHDVVLLSPILAHWNLELRFDEDQRMGERLVTLGGKGYPVNLSGQFAHRQGGGDADCRISDGGLKAQCAIGEGRATLLADAALLESAMDMKEAARREAILDRLLVAAFES